MESESEDIKQEQNLAISPISKPMASDKLNKKILKLVSKLSNYKLLLRGVKEVNKYFKNKSKGNKDSKTKSIKDCFVVLAGDVSPIDVISHIPILCEKNSIPYVYIPSRQALGTASQTKRPTSVVLLIKPPEDNKYEEKYGKIKTVVQKYCEEE